MKMLKNRIAIATTLALLAGAAQAVPVTVSGDFVIVKVSDDGTIGDGNALPALVYDPSGTGTFDFGTDYVAPGSPHEAFGFRSDQTGLIQNENNSSNGDVSGSDDFALVSLADISAGSTFDNHIRWEGEHKGDLLTITHDYFFNDDDERVNIRTVITALEDLTGVSFARAVDPDPDNVPGGTAATNNDRGLDLNNDGDFDDDGETGPSNLVTSVGQVSGRPLGLFSNSDVAHETGIVSSCCSVEDPLAYLAGGDFPLLLPGFDSTGDNGIGLAFDVGSIAGGDSITLDYAYVMGLTFEDIDIPDDDPDDPGPTVPLPGTLALIGLGLGVLGWKKRK